MGTYWYSAYTVYGYAVLTKKKYTFDDIHQMLEQIVIEDPFDIYDIQEEIHSRMEYDSDDNQDEMEKNHGVVVIGFKPSDDMIENCILADKLSIVMEKVKGILQDTEIDFCYPRFYSGIY